MKTFKNTISAMIKDGKKFKKQNGNQIYFNIRNYNTPITELTLPNRALNASARNGIDTIEKMIDVLNNNKIVKLRGIGTKTIKEMKMSILEWQWVHMSEDEKTQYLNSLFE